MTKVTNITSKSELSSMVSKLNVSAIAIKSQIDDLKATLATVTDYDGINMSGAASVLIDNLTNVANNRIITQ